ncbi:malonate decarboxylase subunit epsilon [Halobacillus amylolyticus]|uniref:Malonyl CoA-acyl carrier protein transacylase n=1 Tax=Halobacillus amylolyticus TaxID=2932259 RepID=A0ABY4HG21_9BACI|nr:malonate decarboxylase subunit epsilon [Halobacillus amylolyticus]UOR13579.1 malonate decarboxylase subunit epsilon [Halobacillus amylolyticus]
MTTAFLFPGQGSQQPHMLRHLPDHPIVTETLAEASEQLNESVIFWDTELKLRSTIAVQVCLLVSGVASARLLKEEKAVPDYVAGHSVGAFGAAVVAGSLDFKDAVRLVRKRGEWMEKAFPAGYGMGVVVGLSERKLTKLIKGHVSDENPVYLANINCPRQMTIAGAIPDLRNFMETALANGAQKAELLDVSVPSHCPLLHDVSLRLEAELNDISFRDPTIPYTGNQTARVLKKGKAIKKDLAWNVSHSVRWHESMTLLYELGTRLFVEMLPGNVLKGLVNNAFPTARALSISDNGINTAAILVDRTRTN